VYFDYAEADASTWEPLFDKTAARVVLNHPVNASFSMVLTTPSGAEIDTSAPSPNETVFVSDVQLAVSIPNPESCTWTAVISEQQGVNSRASTAATIFWPLWNPPSCK
jgi:hypothetical protein